MKDKLLCLGLLTLISCSSKSVAEGDPVSPPPPADEPPSEPAPKLDAKTITFETRRWFAKGTPECRKQNTKSFLAQLEKGLMDRCLAEKKSDQVCKVKESAFRSLAEGTPAQHGLCEYLVVITHNDGSTVNFKASRNFDSNKTFKLTRAQSECLRGTEDTISKINPNYDRFMKALVDVNPEMRLTFSFCGAEYFRDEKVWDRVREITKLPRSEFGLEMLTAIALEIYFHEMSHMLSSFGDIMNQSDMPIEAFESRPHYKVYEVTEKAQGSIEFDMLKGSPQTHEVYSALGKTGLNLLHRDTYFGQPKINNYYFILDEWNAYMNQLEFEIVRKLDCSEVSKVTNSVLEFLIYLHVYGKYFERKQPVLYRSLVKNTSISDGVERMLIRSRSLFKRAQELVGKDCKLFEDAAKLRAAQTAFLELARAYGSDVGQL